MTRIERVFLIALAVAAITLVAAVVNENGIRAITGFASSGTATTSVNLLEISSIKTTGSIDFGSGRVDANASNATLDSDAGTVTGGSWTPITQYITVENDGTVNISVNVSADGNNNANGLIGGTNPLFQIKGVATEPDSCTTLQAGYTNVPNSTETPLALCDLLRYWNSADEFNISSKLSIPNDAAPGQRNVTLTFSASKA